MSGKSDKITIGDIISTGSGLVLMVASFLTFVLLIPPTLLQSGTLSQFGPELTGIPGFKISTNLVYLTLIGTLLISSISILSLFYHSDRISKGFTRINNRKYFGFLMIYILIQLILTEIFAILDPTFTNQFPFHETLSVQNFVFSFLTLEESVIYMLVPLTVVIVLSALLQKKSVMVSLRFYNGSSAETVLIATAVAGLTTFFLSGSTMDYVSNFASFFILNIIFLRFGFLKAFITNFAVAMTNVSATLISGSDVLSTLLPLFLFFLGFLGVYHLVQVSVGSQKEEQRIEEKLKKAQLNLLPKPLIEPFIHSRCPVCGNSMYHVNSKDMSLKCEKCEYELAEDATGEKNITIELSRTSRNS